MVQRTGTKMWVWGAVAALAIGLVGIGGPATAAPKTNNSPAATATAAAPAGYTVVVSYSVNREESQLGTVSCTLDGIATDCGSVTPGSTKKLTSYSVTLHEEVGGEHVFEVAFTLTDGGTATASASFFITTLDETCVAADGYMSNDHPSAIWTCRGVVVSGLAPAAPAALAPYCPGSIGLQYQNGGLDRVSCFA